MPCTYFINFTHGKTTFNNMEKKYEKNLVRQVKIDFKYVTYGKHKS